MTLSLSSQPRSRSHLVPARRFPPPDPNAGEVAVRYMVDDYAIDPVRGAELLPGCFVPLSDDRHYRLDLNGDYGQARHEFCGFGNGFYIAFADNQFHAPQSVFMRSPDSLLIFVSSSGDGEYVPAGGAPLSFEAPSSVLVAEPAGMLAAEVTIANHGRYAFLVIHRDVLQTLYEGSEQELPAMLQAFLSGDLERTTGRTLSLGAGMRRCLDDLFACQLEGRRRRHFLQSKTLEMLCQVLEAYDHSEGFRTAETSRLTARGVLKAQRLLAENFVTPPSLEDLAAEVGLSRSALCSGFRQILGQSVFDHIQDLRMQQALQLLSERDDSITQIAYAVGYNRASSFSVAVHRHFGATPSELRRRGSAPEH